MAGRPRSENPSPAALRKREQRERRKMMKTALSAVVAQPATAGYCPAERLRETTRLALVEVWVPKTDVQVIQKTAERLRKASRIPESEVPE